MSKMQREKGNRVEREIVNWHKAIGIHAERVPLSGASRYQGGGHDVDVYPWGRDEAPLVCEVKARKDGAGSTLLRRWLSDYDALFLHEDREDDLVVLPCRVWAELIDAVRSTNTRRKPKSRLVGTTSAKPAGKSGSVQKGDANVHLVEFGKSGKIPRGESRHAARLPAASGPVSAVASPALPLAE